MSGFLAINIFKALSTPLKYFIPVRTGVWLPTLWCWTILCPKSSMAGWDSEPRLWVGETIWGCGAKKAPSPDEDSGQTFHKGFSPEEVAKEAESSSGKTKGTEGLRAQQRARAGPEQALSRWRCFRSTSTGRPGPMPVTGGTELVS